MVFYACSQELARLTIICVVFVQLNQPFPFFRKLFRIAVAIGMRDVQLERDLKLALK